MAAIWNSIVDLGYSVQEYVSGGVSWTATAVGGLFQNLGYNDAPEDFQKIGNAAVDYYFLPLDKLNGRPPFLVYQVLGEDPFLAGLNWWKNAYDNIRKAEEYIKYIQDFNAVPDWDPKRGEPYFDTSSVKSPLSYSDFIKQLNTTFSDWSILTEYPDNTVALAAVGWNATKNRINDLVNGKYGEGTFNYDDNTDQNRALSGYLKTIHTTLLNLIKEYIERAKVINRLIDLWRDYKSWIDAVVDGVPGRNLISPHYCLNNDVGFGGFFWDKYDEFSCEFSHQCS
jgi:hypothetical protein